MSIFSFCLNQHAEIYRYCGVGKSGDADYVPALSEVGDVILCRFEYKRQEITDKDGNKAVGEAEIYTADKLQPMDIIIFDGRTWTVKAVSAIRNLHGEIDHWEGALI